MAARMLKVLAPRVNVYVLATIEQQRALKALTRGRIARYASVSLNDSSLLILNRWES